MDAVAPPRCLGCAGCPTWPAASTTSPRPTTSAGPATTTTPSTRSPPRPAAGRGCSTSAPGPGASPARCWRRASTSSPSSRSTRCARSSRGTSAPIARWPGTRRGAAAARCERRRRRLQRRLALVRRRPRRRRARARRAGPAAAWSCASRYPRWFGSDDAPDWWLDLCVVHTALPKGDHPATRLRLATTRRLRGSSGLRGDRRRARSPSCTTPTATGSSRTGPRCRSWRRCPTVSAPSSSASSTGCSPGAASRGRHPLPGRAVDHSAPASASAAAQIRRAAAS